MTDSFRESLRMCIWIELGILFLATLYAAIFKCGPTDDEDEQ